MPQSQSNLDSCISDPTIGEVHKLVTYCVTTPRQGSLLRFLCWLPFPRPSFIPVRPITSLPPSLFQVFVVLLRSPSTLVEQDSYRTVTRLPLNPSEWTVPPWRTYRSNFSPSPIRSTCLLKEGWKRHLSISTRYPAAGAAFEIYLSRGSDPCPLPLFLMDPGTAPFYGFTLEPCDSSDKLVNQPHSIPIIVGRGRRGNEGKFWTNEEIFHSSSSSSPVSLLLFQHVPSVETFLIWRVTIINYNRRLSNKSPRRRLGTSSRILFPFTPVVVGLRRRDRRAQYVWGRYNTSNRGEMPFHKFFWAFKARNNIWLEIGVAASPSGKKCYLRFPKPETRRPSPPATDHHSTHLQTPFADQAHLPLHFNHYSW